MNFADVVGLAVSGYKSDDIKSLKTLADEQTSEKDLIVLAKKGYKPEDIKSLKDLADKPEPQKDEPKKQDPEPDYKKLYEESQKKIKEIQADNRRDPNNKGVEKTPEEVVLEHVNNILKGI